MKIESLIRRANGTKVEMDGERYHFLPTATDERHQASVEDREHIRRFLAIPEGYRPLEGEVEGVPSTSDIPRTSGVYAAQFKLVNGESITLQELTSRAFTASGLSLQEWNAQEDQDLHEQLDTCLTEINFELTEKGGPVSGYVPDGDANPPAPPALVGSDKFPASIEFGGSAYSLGFVVQGAFNTSGLSVEEWNALEQTDRDARIEAVIERLKPAAPAGQQPTIGVDGGQAGDADEDEDEGDDEGDEDDGADKSDGEDGQGSDATLNRDALAEEYKKKFGRLPHGRLSAERIKQLLDEDGDE